MLVHAGMGKIYNQLTPQERDLLGVLLAKGCSYTEIGRRLRRNKSTISREIARNGPKIRKREYLPNKAQERSDNRRSKTRVVPRIRDEVIREYIIHKLRFKWSPEVIAGRLQLEHPGARISHEAIYQWIYSEGVEYIRYLARRHRRRKRKGVGKIKHKHNIPQRVGIGERPANVASRTIAGHWEVDTAFFHHNREALQVMSERKTRYTMLSKLKDITSDEMRKAMIKRHRYTPFKLRKSFTYDNGRENVCHIYVNNELGTKSYFCNPMCSFEKGTVENTIGIIRQFLPKKAKFDNVTTEEIKRLEKWLNDKPRKCLNFRTPREAYWAERCA